MLARAALFRSFIFVAAIAATGPAAGQNTVPNILGGTTIPSTVPAPVTVPAKSPTSSSAPAADTPATKTAPSTAGGSAPSEVVVWPDRLKVVLIDEVALTEQDGSILGGTARVRARFTEAAGVGTGADKMREVVLRGTMKVQELASEGDEASARRGTVHWTSVMRPDTGRMATLKSPLASQFRTTGAVVAPPTTVNAQGDIASVSDAIELLYGDGAGDLPLADAAPGEAGDTDETSTEGANDFRAPSVGASTAPVASGGAGVPRSETDFQLPETVAAASTESIATPVAGETTEGCPPRVDLQNNVVVVQSRPTENGVATGACSDALDRFPLQKAFTSCNDDIDQAGGSAYATYRRYWVDGGGTTQYVDAECVRDTEQQFSLVENADACSVSVDVNAGTATPRSQLVYTNRTGQTVVVAACRATPGAAAYTITQSAAACQLRHDFTAGVSHRQTKSTYLRSDGVEVVVAPCADDGTSYQHVKVNDESVCAAAVDQTGLTAVKQFRWRIDVDGASQYITECAPDPDTQVALQKDAAACAGTFYHYTEAGQSYGAARWYHSLYGSQSYVTQCQQDTATVYAHQIDIVSYSHNDATKISQPMTRIHFNAGGGVGDVEVSAAQVRAGAAEIPYTLTGAETRATGEVSYTGCDKYTLNANYNVYSRIEIDGGTMAYEENTGAAAPTGPSNACSTSVSTTWNRTSPSSIRHTYLVNGQDPLARCGTFWQDGTLTAKAVAYASSTYEGTRTVTREDGEVQSTTTGQGTTSSPCSVWCPNSNSGDMYIPQVSWTTKMGTNACPATNSDASQISTWKGSLGW